MFRLLEKKSPLMFKTRNKQITIFCMVSFLFSFPYTFESLQYAGGLWEDAFGLWEARSPMVSGKRRARSDNMLKWVYSAELFLAECVITIFAMPFLLLLAAACRLANTGARLGAHCSRSSNMAADSANDFGNKHRTTTIEFGPYLATSLLLAFQPFMFAGGETTRTSGNP